ncbi:MAG: hypothetical protein AB8C84_01545 [Oligoflexales bacterium]
MATAKNIGFIMTLCSIISCASKFSGQVMNDSISNFRNGRVNVLGLENSFQEVITIEKNGNFFIDEDMPNGIYLVEVLIPGYEVFSQKIHIDGRKNIKFHLNKIIMPKKRLNRVSDEFDVSRASGTVSLTPPRL